MAAFTATTSSSRTLSIARRATTDTVAARHAVPPARAMVQSARLVSNRPSASFQVRRDSKRAARMSLRCVAEQTWEVVPVDKVMDLIDGKGFVVVDIRSPVEVQQTGSKSAWEKIPLAAMTDKGPVRNPHFLAIIKEKFPNPSFSRILIGCDDGTQRSEMAAKNITEQLGMSQVKIIEGGLNALMARYPLEEKDLVKWKMSDSDRAGPDTSILMTGVDIGQYQTGV